MAPWCSWLLSLFHLLCSVAISSVHSQELQMTLAMVKPDGMEANHDAAIKDLIKSSGFTIVREKTLQLSMSTAKAFYAEHSTKDFFPDLIKFMTSGPVLVMVLEDVKAVDKWRALIGPTDPKKARSEKPESIRAMYGSNVQRNCVHGSDSTEAALREISFFFKDGAEKIEEVHDEL